MTEPTRAVVRPDDPPNKREPRPAEAAAILAAVKSRQARPSRVAIALENGHAIAPHSSEAGFAAQLADTFGTNSNDFLNVALSNLDQITKDRGTPGKTCDPQALNAAIALLGAIGPKDELEGALAQQMAATHTLAMEMLRRGSNTDRVDHIQLYGGLAMKLQNVFVNQLGALSKLRGGGKQQVEVRHVYVNGNAVIGDVHANGGGGSAAFEHQPHAQGLAHLSGAPIEAVRGKHPERRELPVAGVKRAK